MIKFLVLVKFKKNYFDSIILMLCNGFYVIHFYLYYFIQFMEYLYMYAVNKRYAVLYTIKAIQFCTINQVKTVPKFKVQMYLK